MIDSYSVKNSRILKILGMNSGIYKITNSINKKCYIGSSVDLKKRRYEHFSSLSKNKHTNPHLQRSYNKHGKDNFSFEILELCDIRDLKIIEQRWIIYFNCYKNGYNRTMDTMILGKKLIMPADKRPIYKKPVTMIDPLGNIVKAPSLTEFSQIYNIHISNIGKVLSGKIAYTNDGYRKFDEKIVGVVFNKLQFKREAFRTTCSRTIKFKLVCPLGVVYEGKNLKEFCEPKHLHDGNLGQVIKGNLPHAQGWRKYEPELEGVPFDGPIISHNIHYKFISPTGEIHEGNNISSFSRTFGLPEKTMHSVHAGRVGSYKQWRKYREDGQYSNLKPMFKKFKLINKNTNQIICGGNLTQFAKEYNFCHSSLKRVLAGKYKQHRGWEVYGDNEEKML